MILEGDKARKKQPGPPQQELERSAVHAPPGPIMDCEFPQHQVIQADA
ncbi:hypothetical protein MY11210_002516 [Beauveria gryllotalpidicola]